MRGRLLVGAVVTAFCWLVALWLVLAPITFDTAIGEARCGRPVPAALGGDLVCGERGRKRVGAFVSWLVVTGGVSTAFLASCALARRRTPE